MKRERTVREAERELNSGGYATVLASNMHTCADVFAQRKGQKFVIKIVYNIDSVTRKEADALSKLAQFLDAEPVIVGSTSKAGELKDGINYQRFLIRCVSPEMLPRLDSMEISLLASKSVGIKVMVNGERLRNLRKTNNMKISDLAETARLSRSTLYKHEKSGGYAAISTVAKIERVLSGPIRLETAPESRKLRLQENELARTGMISMHAELAPFDIVAKKKNYYEISLDANVRTLIKRALLYKSIRETFESNYPFFISKNRSGRIRGVPVIKKKELMKAASEDQLLDMVY